MSLHITAPHGPFHESLTWAAIMETGTLVKPNDLRKTVGMKFDDSGARKVRHPEEPRDPVRMLDNLPLSWKGDQWLTTEWVYRQQEIWHKLESHLHADILGWSGVANYDEYEKSGDVVIIVSHPLFWQKDNEWDSHVDDIKETRRLFAGALEINIKKVIVLGGGGIQTREKWQRRLRPLAEIPADVAVMPSHWCETRLFIPVKRGRKAFVEDVMILNRPDVEIKMSGKQFNMKDVRLLMAILRMTKKAPLEDVADTSLYELCRKSGGTKQAYGSNAVNAVLASLNRLNWLMLSVSDKERRTIYSGSLVINLWQDEETGRIKIQFNPLVRRIIDPLNYLQEDYTRSLKESELWFYMAVTKDRPGIRQYRQLREIFLKYSGNKKLKDKNYRDWISPVAKPGLKKLSEDGIISELSITRSRKGGHVATWILSGQENSSIN